AVDRRDLRPPRRPLCHGRRGAETEVPARQLGVKGRSGMARRKQSTKPVALVTGGSRGIGQGICLELARHGYAVAINYAGNEEAARHTQALIGRRSATLLCRADVGVTAERESLVDAVLAHWGRIDVLVNNAGITSPGRRDLFEATEESWERVLAVNLKG